METSGLNQNQIDIQFMKQLKRPATPYEYSKYSRVSPQKLANLDNDYKALNTRQSVSDYLQYKGQDPSMENRAKIAQQYGIQGNGTYEGNVALLKALQSGQPTQTTDTTKVDGSVSGASHPSQTQPPTATPAPQVTPTQQTPSDNTQIQGSIANAAQPQVPSTPLDGQVTQDRQNYSDFQSQVRDYDKQLNDFKADKLKKIAAGGGTVTASQFSAEIAAEMAPLLSLRKQAAAGQSDAGKMLQSSINQQKSYQSQMANQQKIAETAKKDAFTQNLNVAKLNQGQQRIEAQKTQFEQKLKLSAQKSIKAKSRIASGTSTSSDIKDIANAIMNGSQPPVLTGLYSKSSAVKAELARKGFNLTKATQDWKATDKYLSTMNSASITKLRTSTQFVIETVPKVKDAVAEWNKQIGSGRYPVLNKVNLLAAEQGTYGKDAQVAATAFGTYIADMTSELGTVYKGGNSSTDESLKLAAKNLESNWSIESLNKALDIIEQNTKIRQSSLNNVGVAGISNNSYEPEKSAQKDTNQKDPLGLF